jgi:hypothetical protein
VPRLLTTPLLLAALTVAASACSSDSPTSPSPASGASGAPFSAQGNGGSSAPGTAGTASVVTPTSALGYSLRFAGNAATEVDRVKVPIDPHVAADVSGDFTVEFWIKAEPGANSSSTCQAGSDGWTYGNVILDRSVTGDGDWGEYGISLSGGRIAFGVGRSGRSQTICGLIDVSDGRWHHVALTRRTSDGQMRIYVDGTESAQGIGPAGDISYRDGRPTASPSDPFLILGTAKDDDGTAGLLGFSGWIDDLRISSRVRYAVPFDRPSAAFTTDADTALLYHFDEGPTGACLSSVLDTSGRGSHGQCRYGGIGAVGPLYASEVPFVPAPARQRTWLLGADGKPIPLDGGAAAPDRVGPPDTGGPVPH